MNRPVITGMGAIAAAGTTPELIWQNVKTGPSPAQWWTPSADYMGPAIPVCSVTEAPRPSFRWADKADRCVWLAWHAAIHAWKQAQLDECAHDRVGIIMGSARGPVSKILESDRFTKKGRIPPSFAANTTMASLSGWLSLGLDVKGPCLTVSASCASSAHAIALAADMVAGGQVDVMLAGGTEAPLLGAVIGPFQTAGILAKHRDPSQACRPFDRDRNGMVLGEGAAVLVIESQVHAFQRGVRPLACLQGWAMGSEAWGRTSAREDGDGLYRVLCQALDHAEVPPQQIDYFNAHGTGTQMNDRVEAVALKRLLGSRASQVPCSSTKPVTGHCLGASPALESVLCLLALRDQYVPPTLNCEVIDSECELDPVTGQGREQRLDVVVSHSQGFWGNNAALVFRRIPL